MIMVIPYVYSGLKWTREQVPLQVDTVGYTFETSLMGDFLASADIKAFGRR